MPKYHSFKKYKRILIARLDRIGDVLLSTPVIKAVRQAFPDSYIAFMVRPYAREIVEGNPYLDKVIIYDKDREHKGIKGNVNFIRALRSEKFDLAILLHPTNRAHIIIRLAGIPERIGYDRKFGFLLTIRIPHTKQYGMKHEVDYVLDMLKFIGIEAKDKTLYMPVNDFSEKKIGELLRGYGIKDTDILIVMNPGASCISKRWDLKSFAETALSFIANYNAKIAIIAGPSDKAIGDKLHSLIKGSLNLSGATTIGDMASLLKRADLFISNDSGPVHIGCAAGVPVISIFGRSDRGLSPRRWGPIGRDSVALHKADGCDICYAHNCKIGFKCLSFITADDVISAASEILEKRTKRA